MPPNGLSLYVGLIRRKLYWIISPITNRHMLPTIPRASHVSVERIFFFVGLLPIHLIACINAGIRNIDTRIDADTDPIWTG